MSFFRRVKRSEVFPLPVDLNCGPPSSTVSTHTEHSDGIVTAWAVLIHQVHGLCYIAQIGKAIVCRIAVDVVNYACRPYAVKVQPREAMGAVVLSIDHQLDIAVTSAIASNLSCSRPTSDIGTPAKLSCFRVVVQKLAQFLGGKILNSHRRSFKARSVRCPFGATTPAGFAHSIREVS